MKKPRVSIAGLMAFVFLIAVGFAALKNPSQLGASIAFTLTMAMLLLALVGVGFRRGDRQLRWAGFAAFGWGYLVTALITSDLRPPALPSSSLLSHLSQIMLPPTRVVMTGSNGTFTITATPIMAPNQPELMPFLQIGHSLAALLVAMLGSRLVGVFARRDEGSPRDLRPTTAPVIPEATEPE